MASDNSINRISYGEIGVIFEEIAALSSQCERLFYYMSEDETDDPGNKETRDRVVRSLIGNIGMLSEVGYRGVTGSPGMLERVEDWVLPPSYQSQRSSKSVT